LKKAPQFLASMTRVFLATAATCAVAAAPAVAFDGYHLESSTTLDSAGSSWDYVSLDPTKGHVYIGHRKESLQVFDTATKKIIATVEKTASSNGATVIPELDLGVSNNGNGTLTPFKMSTFAAGEPIKLGEEVDTSHYDPATKRLFVNMAGVKDAAGKETSDIVVMDVTTMKEVSRINMPSGKLEHAVVDGKGSMYIVARDTSMVYTIDTKAMKTTAERKIEGCEGANSIDMDVANNRLMIACRGKGASKPALAVMDNESGKVVFKAEIGGGNDGVIYDAAAKRIITLDGLSSTLIVFEQVDKDTYKMSEALGTRPGVRSFGYDPKTRKVYSVTAEGSADASKKILTSVGPFYPNSFFPNTFVVLTYAPK
jgi:hypothetical protein